PGEASRLEGYLFPDTYEFYQGMQASSAINKFLLNFHGKLTADMYTQADNLGISLHQAVIIASMLESEAANDEERSIITSVIYISLALVMPLLLSSLFMYAFGVHKEYLTFEAINSIISYITFTSTRSLAGLISNLCLA